MTVKKMHISTPTPWLRCCPFYGGDSVVVDSFLYVPHFVCGGSVFGFCFVTHFFVSFQNLKSS